MVIAIRFFDVFAGIGGFRSGLEQAGGFKCVGFCEIDRYGMIYINGFGWVVDNGGGGTNEYVYDMYENGNKIGYFG